MALEAGGLTHACLQQMQVAEFYDHVVFARHRIASNTNRLIGALSILSPYASKSWRASSLDQIKRDATFGCKVVDVYERSSLHERLKLIGASLKSKSADGWRRSRQGREQLIWLQQAGYTEDEVTELYQKWRDELQVRIDRATENGRALQGTRVRAGDVTHLTGAQSLKEKPDSKPAG